MSPFLSLSTQLIKLNYPGILSCQGSNLSPLFKIFKSQLELKKNKNNNKNHHDSQRLTKCDPTYDFRYNGDNTQTTHQHILQKAKFVLPTFTNSSKKCIDL